MSADVPIPLGSRSTARQMCVDVRARWWTSEPSPGIIRSMVDDGWDERVEAIRQAKRDRAAQLQGYEEIVGDIESLLFEHDPIGINFETNTDEYRPEAETITIRLREATDVDAATRIVHEEFVRWFSSSSAGSEDRYRLIAAKIWALWKERARGA